MLRVRVGNTSGLASLANRLRALSGGLKAELEKEFARKGAEETRQAIASGRSPYGEAWPSPAPGVQRMASTVGLDGTAIVVRHPWASLHNRGFTSTGKMRFRGHNGWRSAKTIRVPARPMSPDRGMPARWRSSYLSSAMAVVRRRLGV